MALAQPRSLCERHRRVTPHGLVFEDQSTEPKERDTTDPQHFERRLDRRGLDRRVARVGHDDEDQVQSQAD